MSSIIEELEREVLDKNSRMPDLLRKMKVISSKLSLQGPYEWVEHELTGYKGDVPSYRVLMGKVKVQNPFHGWQPVMFDNSESEKQFCEYHVGNPVSELEDFVKSGSKMVISLSGPACHILSKASGMPLLPMAVFIPNNVIVRTIDTIRTRILDMVLSIQAAGIKGEGLSFSPEEKAVALNPGVVNNIGNIGNFAGNLGGSVGRDVNASSAYDASIEIAKIPDFISQIRASQEQMNLSPDSRARLAKCLEEMDGELRMTPPSQGKLANLLRSVKTIAEGATGNMIAAGICALANGIKL